jgi:sugar O-acyltransferase (sialic acid O-acetyltransferase NeuD family)
MCELGGGADIVLRMAVPSKRGARPPLQREPKGERVVIVGTGETASLAFEYFCYDSPHKIVAFSAEAAFITAGSFCGLPLVPFEELAENYPPDDYRAFVSVSLTQLNRVRRRLFDGVKKAGFDCVSYVSGHAFVLPSAHIGENTFVQEHTAVQHGAYVGDNVFLSSGTVVGHSSVVEDDVFTGPHAAICGMCRIGQSSFIGANCSISGGLTVAADCIIGAGANVLANTEPGQVYIGNPARPTGRDSFSTFHVQPG